jgi:iron complex transport system substrate-binding protein
MLFALGAGDDVVGVTFECDHPEEARERTIVSNTALPEGLSPAEIDAVVRERMAAGEELYRLDAGALHALDPDVVVTQDLCAVCAVDVSTVDDALSHLGCRADVVTIDPGTLDEVLASIEHLGAVTGTDERAAALVADLRARLARVADAVRGRPGPRMAVLEWTDPLFNAGHWVPDMVTAAGATPVLAASGQRSTVITWQDVASAEPDVIVVSPCGFRLEGCIAMARALRESGKLTTDAPVWAVDADAAFVRPGPRLVDGVEALAAIAHPDVMPSRPELAVRI